MAAIIKGLGINPSHSSRRWALCNILLPETEVAEVPLRFHMLTLQRRILHPATAKISSSQDQAWPSRSSPLPNESFLVMTAWKLSSCSATPCNIKILSLRVGLHVVSLQQNFDTERKLNYIIWSILKHSYTKGKKRKIDLSVFEYRDLAGKTLRGRNRVGDQQGRLWRKL